MLVGAAFALARMGRYEAPPAPACCGSRSAPPAHRGGRSPFFLQCSPELLSPVPPRAQARQAAHHHAVIFKTAPAAIHPESHLVKRDRGGGCFFTLGDNQEN